MSIKRNLMAGIVLSLALGPVPVSAGNNGLLPGLIIGGIIGSELQRNNRNRRSSRVRIPSTSEGREIQTSLNYFNFPVGTVDGQLGRRSRTAISNYQAYMGFPVTGALTDFEKDFLVSSYERAILGGNTTAQQIASTGNGTTGLLTIFRDQMAATGGNGATKDASGITSLVANNDASEDALPSFFGSAGGSVSLASQCNQVSLLTNTNGGFTTEVSMVDPVFALNEQFCLARTYAIAKGEEMASKVQGFTPQQISAQCESFGPALQQYVSSLSLSPMETVLQDVGGFVLKTGMSPSQLSGTAQICLSVGYRTDDMNVAIGSALLLTALGEKPYGEIIGHHLGLGFGTAERRDLAMAWYQMGLDSIANGADAVFAPGQPERNALIQKAVFSMNGDAQSGTGSANTLQPVALPNFSANDG